jgi:hypothetical protein
MGELVRAFFEGDFRRTSTACTCWTETPCANTSSLEQRLSDTLAGSVSVLRSIDGEVSPQSSVFYGSGNRGYFYSARRHRGVPTRTGVAFLVRSLRQATQTQAAVLANDSTSSRSRSRDLSIIGLAPFSADWNCSSPSRQARGTAVSSQTRTPPRTAPRRRRRRVLTAERVPRSASSRESPERPWVGAFDLQIFLDYIQNLDLRIGMNPGVP